MKKSNEEREIDLLSVQLALPVLMERIQEITKGYTELMEVMADWKESFIRLETRVFQLERLNNITNLYLMKYINNTNPGMAEEYRKEINAIVRGDPTIKFQDKNLN